MTLLGRCRKKVRGAGVRAVSFSSSTTGGVATGGLGGTGVGGGTSLPQLPGAAASSGSTSEAGGSQAVELAPVWASTSSTAPTASTRPAPTAQDQSCQPAPRSLPGRLRIASGSAAGSASSIRAATAAAWGAAAEVPQKRQKGEAKKAKKVVLPQSVAVRSGLLMTSSGGPRGAAGVVPSTGPKP